METKINGLSVYTFGSPEKEAIVFAHGFPYDHLMWKNQYEALSSDYYCVTYDIRGLGESEVGDGQYTMELFVDDLFEVIGKLGLKKPAICGLSMGGYLTLQALQRNQEVFSAVVLTDTHPKADDNAGKLKRSNAIRTINKEGLAAYVESFVPGTFSVATQTSKPPYYIETIERCKQNNPIGVKGSQLAMLSRFSSEEFLKEITLPTLVLVGEEDALTPPAVMEAMAKEIPHSEFYVISNAGHMSPLENPAEFNAKLKAFLDRHLKHH